MNSPSDPSGPPGDAGQAAVPVEPGAAASGPRQTEPSVEPGAAASHASSGRAEAVYFALALLLSLKFAIEVVRAVGSLEFPLDDTYIYLQYARNLAEGRLFTYWPSAGYAPGATSPLYPFLLAPAFWLGLDGARAIPYVWVLSALVMGGCATLAVRIGRHFAGDSGAWIAGGMLLATGSWLWGALSGMEIGVFTYLALLGCWMLIRDAEAGFVPGPSPDTGPVRIEATSQAGSASGTISNVSGVAARREATRAARGLWATTALLSVARPEGMPMALALAGCALLRRGRRRRPLSWLIWPLALTPYVVVALLNRAHTGHTVPNTALYKSALFFPRQSTENLLRHARAWLNELVQALLVGLEGRILLPLAWATVLVALGWLGARAIVELKARAAFPLSWLLMAILGQVPLALLAQNPSQFYRYYHVVFALVSVAAGIAVARGIDHARARLPGRDRAFAVLTGIVLAALGAMQWTQWGRAFTAATQDIRGQQVTMARWIGQHLPPDARLLLNDVGAITYLTQRDGFDLVGLATNLQARVFLEGPGAVFERIERFPVAERPTHIVVYPEWLGLPALLGRELFRASLGHASSVVAYPDAAAYAPDWSPLETGEAPRMPLPEGAKVVDAVDVADLDAETSHGYQLQVPALERGRRFSTFVGDYVDAGARTVDGGRAITGAERFSVAVPEVRTAGLRLRLELSEPAVFRVSLDGKPAGVLELPARGGFTEVDLALPDLAGRPGTHTLVVEARPGSSYRIFHYWLWGA